MRDLVIGGRRADVRARRCPPGPPSSGMLLEAGLFEEVIDDPTRNQAERLIARAKEILPELPDQKPHRGKGGA